MLEDYFEQDDGNLDMCNVVPMSAYFPNRLLLAQSLPKHEEARGGSSLAASESHLVPIYTEV